jgi:hypothetical protein
MILDILRPLMSAFLPIAVMTYFIASIEGFHTITNLMSFASLIKVFVA